MHQLFDIIANMLSFLFNAVTFNLRPQGGSTDYVDKFGVFLSLLVKICSGEQRKISKRTGTEKKVGISFDETF